jgi:hypothetical protein
METEQKYRTSQRLIFDIMQTFTLDVAERATRVKRTAAGKKRVNHGPAKAENLAVPKSKIRSLQLHHEYNKVEDKRPQRPERVRERAAEPPPPISLPHRQACKEHST